MIMKYEDIKKLRKRQWDHIQDINKAIEDGSNLYVLDANGKNHRVYYVRNEDSGIDMLKTEHGFHFLAKRTDIFLDFNDDALKEC